jgi:hypothetical protein
MLSRSTISAIMNINDRQILKYKIYWRHSGTLEQHPFFLPMTYEAAIYADQKYERSKFEFKPGLWINCYQI